MTNDNDNVLLVIKTSAIHALLVMKNCSTHALQVIKTSATHVLHIVGEALPATFSWLRASFGAIFARFCVLRTLKLFFYDSNKQTQTMTLSRLSQYFASPLFFYLCCYSMFILYFSYAFTNSSLFPFLQSVVILLRPIPNSNLVSTCGSLTPHLTFIFSLCFPIKDIVWSDHTLYSFCSFFTSDLPHFHTWRLLRSFAP